MGKNSDGSESRHADICRHSVIVSTRKPLRNETIVICFTNDNARKCGRQEVFLTDMTTTNTSSILIAGHRGLPLEYPDNTKEGILAATAICDMVEFDVRRTRDGVAVLSHDAHVGGRAIIDTDWPALAEVDLGGGLHPARLDDVLRAAGEFPFNFEIKNSPVDPDFDETFAFAREAAGRASDRDLVTSFHWPTVDAVRADYPNLTTGLLVGAGGSIDEAAGWATNGGHQVIAPHWSLLGDQPAARIAKLLKTGLRIVVWTVNDEGLAHNLAAGGAAAIITDDPIRMDAALRGKDSDEYQR